MRQTCRFKGVAHKKNVTGKNDKGRRGTKPVQQPPSLILHLEEVAEQCGKGNGKKDKKQSYTDKLRIVFLAKSIRGKIFLSLDHYRM